MSFTFPSPDEILAAFRVLRSFPVSIEDPSSTIHGVELPPLTIDRVDKELYYFYFHEHLISKYRYKENPEERTDSNLQIFNQFYSQLKAKCEELEFPNLPEDSTSILSLNFQIPREAAMELYAIDPNTLAFQGLQDGHLFFKTTNTGLDIRVPINDIELSDLYTYMKNDDNS